MDIDVSDVDETRVLAYHKSFGENSNKDFPKSEISLQLLEEHLGPTEMEAKTTSTLDWVATCSKHSVHSQNRAPSWSDLLQKTPKKKLRWDDWRPSWSLSLETLHGKRVRVGIPLPNLRRSSGGSWVSYFDSIFDKNLAINKQCLKIEKTTGSHLHHRKRARGHKRFTIYQPSKYEKICMKIVNAISIWKLLRNNIASWFWKASH